MSFDGDHRIIIKQRFEFRNAKRTNSLKLVEFEKFVQIYINDGNSVNRGQMRLYPEQIKELKEFLEKVEIKG